jgi:hypothetical protein
VLDRVFEATFGDRFVTEDEQIFPVRTGGRPARGKVGRCSGRLLRCFHFAVIRAPDTSYRSQHAAETLTLGSGRRRIFARLHCGAAVAKAGRIQSESVNFLST